LRTAKAQGPPEGMWGIELPACSCSSFLAGFANPELPNATGELFMLPT